MSLARCPHRHTATATAAAAATTTALADSSSSGGGRGGVAAEHPRQPNENTPMLGGPRRRR